jgi:hypothetical protein
VFGVCWCWQSLPCRLARAQYWHHRCVSDLHRILPEPNLRCKHLNMQYCSQYLLHDPCQCSGPDLIVTASIPAAVSTAYHRHASKATSQQQVAANTSRAPHSSLLHQQDPPNPSQEPLQGMDHSVFQAAPLSDAHLGPDITAHSWTHCEAEQETTTKDGDTVSQKMKRQA